MMDTPGISIDVFNDADTAFHVAIAQAAGNQLFSDLTGAIRTSLRASIFASFNRGRRSADAHVPSCRHSTIRSWMPSSPDDTEEAARVTEEHIRFAASELPGLTERAAAT
jgi:GntR family transcriptional repressor for pyruvate dehydrogenase complex